MGETPPVAPGKSPFRIKGLGYLGHLAWVDSSFPGGRAAFLAALSPSMREFFSQTFLAITHYDFLPLVAAGAVCARILKMTLPEFVEMRARHQASLDVGGVYRVILKLTSAKLVAGKLPKMMAKYFDFGDVKLLRDETRLVEFEATPIPNLAIEWFVACYTGYVEVTLGAAGAMLPTLDAEATSVGELHGFPASRLVGTVRWS